MVNGLRGSEFMCSAPHLGALCPDAGREVAFLGRSNVGKSTLLNALVDQRRLAKTSKTPGCTQAINLFAVAGQSQRRLADLPGYGYAKVHAAKQRAWDPLMQTYFEQRESLVACLVMLDIRRGLMAADLDLLAWLGTFDLGMALVLNKTDKLSRQAVQQVQRDVLAQLETLGLGQVNYFALSAQKKQGIQPLSAWILRQLSGSQ